VERLARWLDGFTERHGATVTEADATEVRLTGSDGARAWLIVPFPPLPAVASGEDPRAALIAHTARGRTVGVLLVRRGGHAVGVFAGTDLVASKVGSAYVQGTTRAGGWSQQRFARRRANQARAAFSDAANAATRILLPYAAQLDAIMCGGDRAAVETVLADPRLVALGELRRGPFLDVPDPRLRILQATPDQFRAVQVTLEP
jgi:Actinobacteria/chloroflexi VLRF1 release factor